MSNNPHSFNVEENQDQIEESKSNGEGSMTDSDYQGLSDNNKGADVSKSDFSGKSYLEVIEAEAKEQISQEIPGAVSNNEEKNIELKNDQAHEVKTVQVQPNDDKPLSLKEFNSSISSLKTDLTNEISSLKTDLTNEISSLKTDLTNEMRSGFSLLADKIDELISAISKK